MQLILKKMNNSVVGNFIIVRPTGVELGKNWNFKSDSQLFLSSQTHGVSEGVREHGNTSAFVDYFVAASEGLNLYVRSNKL